jgi:hypothetical protein
MNRKIYKALAKKHGVSVEEIKRDMQEAVNAAYKTPTTTAQSFMKNGAAPTVEEFVNHIAETIKNEETEETSTEIERFNNLIDTPLMNLIMDLWVSVGNNILVEQNLLSEFKNKESENLNEFHFGLGLYLRNNILTTDSELYIKFQENGVHDCDDMSAVIISTWHTALQQEQ